MVELTEPSIEDVRFDYFIDAAAVNVLNRPIYEKGVTSSDETHITNRTKVEEAHSLVDGKLLSKEEANDNRAKEHPRFNESQALPLMNDSDWPLPAPPPNKESSWIWHPEHGYVPTDHSADH